MEEAGLMGWHGHTTDTDAINDKVSGEIAALTEKTIPIDADLVIIEDSAASNAKKKVQVGNLPGGGGGGGLGSGTTNLIGEVELTSSATQINFTDISQAYTDLLIVADLRTDRAAVSTDEFYMRVGNGSIDSGTNYSYRRRFEGSSTNTISSAAADHWEGGVIAAVDLRWPMGKHGSY
jgi:hypothetical protein